MLGGGAALNIHRMTVGIIVTTLNPIAVFVRMLQWVGRIIQGERNATVLVGSLALDAPRHRKGTED